ncbi:MAG: long-chain fatty acid--CoA ligase [Chloroflexi bacterium]|nr:MAG: long-chain fatty acid--CoA ligase [Chloroflexota bacterium]
MLGGMAMRVKPAWAIHRQPGSPIPLEDDAARRYLRRGNLREALLRGGDRPALVAGGLGFSHDQLRAAAAAAAKRLSDLGITPGMPVALFAENSAAWIVSYLGLQWIGATVVGMNPAFKEAEAAQILVDSAAAAVLVDAGRQTLIDRLRARLPALQTTLRVEDVGSSHPSALVGVGEGGGSLNPESPALLLYTSGTTGKPKGALLDHGNLLAQGRGVVEAWRWTAEDRLVLALPLFHVHGLAIALHGSLIAGGCAVLVPFSPETVVRELQAGGTMFFGVPAMYQRLCDYLDQHPADLRQVRLFVAGSAPLPVTLFERCERILGQPVLERYGITEGGIVVSNPYDGPRQPGRVGYPLPGVEVRLGEQDEVQLKGGQVFKGYWRNPAASADVFSEGWFRTGDIGEIGEDGTLAIRGRIKELIISGGYNVYPREVEMVLEQHPAVAEVAVAGLPSERWGEEVTAFVVARSPVEANELISYARDRLATYKCPRAVHFIDALPRNAMGKVDRSKLP